MLRSTFRRLQVTTLSMTLRVSAIIEIELREGPIEGQQDWPISQLELELDC